MISNIFHQLFLNPLRNLLIWLSSILPGHSLGLAIIILTIGVKLILLPLYHKTNVTQRRIRELEPKLKEIKTQQANNREEQAKQIMALYREHGINPLTSFWLLLIQIPIVLALFWVFRDSSNIPAVNATLFGLSLTSRNYVLAILVGVSQFIQMRLAVPPIPSTTSSERSFKDDLARSMNLQARYLMPVFITIVCFSFPAALTLYWLTSNLFAIGHELIVKRRATMITVGGVTTNTHSSGQ